MKTFMLSQTAKLNQTNLIIHAFPNKNQMKRKTKLKSENTNTNTYPVSNTKTNTYPVSNSTNMKTNMKYLSNPRGLLLFCRDWWAMARAQARRRCLRRRRELRQASARKDLNDSDFFERKDWIYTLWIWKPSLKRTVLLLYFFFFNNTHTIRRHFTKKKKKIKIRTWYRFGLA